MRAFVVHVTYIVTKCAHMRFTESSFHSWSLYSIIDYTRHLSCRQVIRVPHGEIA